MNSIELSIYAGLFSAICEEMGTALMRSAFSPNIKERRDFSTALFTAEGDLLAQAAHVPVHLGSMGFALQGIRGKLDLKRGDVACVNDPYLGGTHLPDITVIAPVHAGRTLIGYVVNRAHHADVGGSQPGSMPVARRLEEEGQIISPCKLISRGRVVDSVMQGILDAVRTPEERRGDLGAQVAANHVGATRLAELAERDGNGKIRRAMKAVIEYGERLSRDTVRDIPDGTYRSRDLLDDDGFGNRDIPICCRVDVEGESLRVDFAGTASQVEGNLNAVYPVTFAAVAYCLRCLMPPDTPSSAGCFRPLDVRAPEGSLLNPRRPAAVAAGNVETSQRVVDTVLAALAQALPDRIPAASAGTMNNLTLGGEDPVSGGPFGYYETLAGGMGGRPRSPGLDAVQTHMTNTLNTPVESLELHYPLRVLRYTLRRGSGGAGRMRGGNGVIREVQVLVDTSLSLLTERRRRGPPGTAGGKPGQAGRNLLKVGGRWTALPGKTVRLLRQGETLRIETPGGGGHGSRIKRRQRKRAHSQ